VSTTPSRFFACTLYPIPYTLVSMDRLITFERITIEPPLEAIYRRLGYRKGLTQIKPGEAKALGESIEQARSLITLKGAARRLPSFRRKPPYPTAGNLCLESTHLAALLANSQEVLLLGATAGAAVIEAIRRDTAADNPDAGRHPRCCGKRDGRCRPGLDGSLLHAGSAQREPPADEKRFSCGYGDLALENQKLFHDLLDWAVRRRADGAIYPRTREIRHGRGGDRKDTLRENGWQRVSEKYWTS